MQAAAQIYAPAAVVQAAQVEEMVRAAQQKRWLTYGLVALGVFLLWRAR
jgi:hypothetical protein